MKKAKISSPLDDLSIASDLLLSAKSVVEIIEARYLVQNV
jgi:hypothetical protein